MNMNKEKSIIPIFFIFLLIISLISVIFSYFISKEKKSIVVINKNNPVVLSILKNEVLNTNSNESSETVKVFIDSEEETLYDLKVDVNTKQAVKTMANKGKIELTVINSEEEIIDKIDITNLAGTIYEMKLSAKEPTKFIFTYIDYDGLYLEPNFRIK